MSAAIQLAVNFTTETCCNKDCGMPFAMPTDFYRARSSSPGSAFFCPRGHGQHYTGETEEAKLRRQLESERNNSAFWRERKDETERRLAAQRAQTTRAKNEAKRIKGRIAAGVCPCCNRTFKQLTAHMKAKHPDYAEHREPGDLEALP